MFNELEFIFDNDEYSLETYINDLVQENKKLKEENKKLSNDFRELLTKIERYKSYIKSHYSNVLDY